SSRLRLCGRHRHHERLAQCARRRARWARRRDRRERRRGARGLRSMSPRPDPPEVDRIAAGRAAVAARQARAAVKAAIANRSRTALDAAQQGWREPESTEAGMRVRELLGSIPGLGPTRVARVLEELGISDKKR